MNEKKISKRKKSFKETTKVIAETGIALIAILLLANVVYAAVPISDGFDYPVGIPQRSGGSGYVTEMEDDGDGWYNVQNFGVPNSKYENKPHLGEDWNEDITDTGGSTANADCGDPVYSIANGEVIYAQNGGSGWGNVVIVRHKLLDNTLVESLYAHLNSISVNKENKIARGEGIGTVGDGDLDGCNPENNFADPHSGYWAHLHFEIRYSNAVSWGIPGDGYSFDTTGWTDPSNFIDNHRPQIFPVIGDWDGNGIDETGTFNPRESRFILKDSKDKEYKNQQIGEAGDLPIVGDWNGDGSTNNEDTIGVYRPKEAKFYLDNNNDGIVEDTPEEKFLFGNIGDYPLVGDWDGNGRDEVGVYRVSDDGKKATFYLKKAAVAEEVTFDITANDTPIIGDWNNDGTDDVGIFRRYDADHELTSVFHLKFDGKITEIAFGDNTDIPVAGKMKKDKLTRIGIYRPSSGEFHFDTKPVVPKSDKPSLNLDYPAGGETWLLGSTETIQWTSNGNVGTNLNIALLKKGALVSEMTASISTNSASMTISDTQAEGKDYQVRITSVEKPEYSSISNHFAINSGSSPTPTPTPTPPTPPPAPTGPVHNVNKNKDYAKIQDAINNANSEDKINVYSGTYRENVNVTRKLIIEGIDLGSGMPAIDGLKKDSVVRLYAGNVTFRNFTLVNASDWSAGIDVPSSGNQILYNKIKNNSYGINFGYNSRDNIVTKNMISNGTTGIQLGYFTRNNTFQKNDITDNEYSIYLMYTTKNIFDGNYIRSSHYGLYFFYGADYSTDNWIYRNKFIGNTNDTYILYPYPSANIWNSTTPITYAFNGKTYQSYLGNYWDKYAGADSDKDGIGDTPYVISDVSKEMDSYPLVSQNIG